MLRTFAFVRLRYAFAFTARALRFSRYAFTRVAVTARVTPAGSLVLYPHVPADLDHMIWFAGRILPFLVAPRCVFLLWLRLRLHGRLHYILDPRCRVTHFDLSFTHVYTLPRLYVAAYVRCRFAYVGRFLASLVRCTHVAFCAFAVYALHMVRCYVALIVYGAHVVRCVLRLVLSPRYCDFARTRICRFTDSFACRLIAVAVPFGSSPASPHARALPRAALLRTFVARSSLILLRYVCCRLPHVYYVVYVDCRTRCALRAFSFVAAFACAPHTRLGCVCAHTGSHAQLLLHHRTTRFCGCGYAHFLPARTFTYTAHILQRYGLLCPTIAVTHRICYARIA